MCSTLKKVHPGLNSAAHFASLYSESKISYILVCSGSLLIIQRELGNHAFQMKVWIGSMKHISIVQKHNHEKKSIFKMIHKKIQTVMKSERIYP